MSDRVIVLSGRPAQVKNEYEIALALPAERTPLNSRTHRNLEPTASQSGRI